MSKPYKTCESCGDHLDAGEICGCKEANSAEAPQPARAEAGQKATGNPLEPVLSAGA